jgi:hypothetical protein
VIDAQDLPDEPLPAGQAGRRQDHAGLHAAARRLEREVTSCRLPWTRARTCCDAGDRGEARLRYVASPLVTAMLRGECHSHEGNRMSEKSWASLAPLSTTGAMWSLSWRY